VALTTDNPGLLGLANSTFDLAKGTGSVDITAKFAANVVPQFGAGKVMVTATDDQGFVGSLTFNVTVNFVNHNPSISPN
jgi:hypothetical protein